MHLPTHWPGFRVCCTIFLLITASQANAAGPSAAKPGNEPVVKEAPASKAVETLLQEEHALFGRPFTLETGFSYSRYDRKQLILNGFLALDAIFLGNISVDSQEADIFTLDFTGRYSLSQRLQMDMNVPFLYRRTVFQKVGASGGSTSALNEEAVTTEPGVNVGDVSAGIYFQLKPETPANPDIVWNVRLKAPTGTHPYGVKTVELGSGSDTFTVPEELPSGNGVWSLSTGFSFVRTLDPAILFANVSYFHNFAQKFDDISSAQGTVTPGRVDLGDSLQIGLGLAFALNERLSMSFSYAHRLAGKSRIKTDGSDWTSITGSDANAVSINLGATYAMSDKLSMVTSVGIGLTPDAPDVIFSMKFPYSF